MDAYEIAGRARALPEVCAGRVHAEGREGLRLMEEGGEYGELTVELAATLAHAGAVVTRAEQRELRELLVATGMPTGPADQLKVQD